MNEILVAIDKVEDAALVLPKVGRMMQSDDGAPTHLTATRVVYEGLADLQSEQLEGAPDLKQYVLEAETSALNDTLQQVTDLPVEGMTIWHKNKWRGILEVADAIGASMIIKQVCEPESSIYVRTPDDWNLLRHSSVPVLLSHSAWTRSPTVFAALDVYDRAHAQLNRRVLQNARDLAMRMDAALHVVCVYPRLQPWVRHIATQVDSARVKANIETEITQQIDALCADCAVEHYQLHCREGHADLEIESVAATAAVVVLGTKARSGVSAFMLGNTAEKILHSVKTDVLTVP